MGNSPPTPQQTVWLATRCGRFLRMRTGGFGLAPRTGYIDSEMESSLGTLRKKTCVQFIRTGLVGSGSAHMVVGSSGLKMENSQASPRATDSPTILSLQFMRIVRGVSGSVHGVVSTVSRIRILR